MVKAMSVCQCNSAQDLVTMPGAEAQFQHMQSAVDLLLRGLGEDPTREGLRDTPRRVAKAWLDIASGYTQECTRAFGNALFHEPIVSSGSDGMVVVRDITFAAISEHTLLPFHGRCHIAYIPRGGVILGLSKLARVTKCLASKLQQQELFTHNLMSAIQSEVGPHGVAVVVQANHLGGPCQPMTQVTSAVSGCFQDRQSGLLLEFLTLLRLSGISAVTALLSGTQQGAAAAAAAAAATAGPQLQHFTCTASPSQCAECGTAGAAAPVGRLEMAAAVKALLEGVGEAPSRPGLKGSPERYVQWLFAATAGYRMSLPAPAGCACGAQESPPSEEAPAACEESPSAPGLCGRDGSPEAPATPEDHSPDASCASSDDMSADEPPCCLASTLMSAELGVFDPAEELSLRSSGSSEPDGSAQQQQQQGGAQICTFSAQFASQCEHHLLPFYGTLQLAYQLPPAGEGPQAVPDEAAARQQLQHIVEMFSKRLQVQERLSHQVADAALGVLGAASVLVVVDSAHMCMVARGVEKHASTTLTTASRGAWAEDAVARTQAMVVLLSQ